MKMNAKVRIVKTGKLFKNLKALPCYHHALPSPRTEVLIYNLRQNIWNKIEKSSKSRQGKKILISTFACFLTAIA